jgi:hypothetical protein
MSPNSNSDSSALLSETRCEDDTMLRTMIDIINMIRIQIVYVLRTFKWRRPHPTS